MHLCTPKYGATLINNRELPEWSNGSDSKSEVLARVPGVRIPRSLHFSSSVISQESLSSVLTTGYYRLTTFFREVSEWLKEHAWKVCIVTSSYCQVPETTRFGLFFASFAPLSP